jgi:hypothetical protein
MLCGILIVCCSVSIGSVVDEKRMRGEKRE